jgi:hypothetical protein
MTTLAPFTKITKIDIITDTKIIYEIVKSRIDL